MPILIVIVSGLPGAGKSTLISELMKHVEMLSVTEGSTLFRLEHICFDNIFDCSRGLRPWSAESPAEWKHSRGVMMATINETVERLRKGRSERDVGEKAVVFVDDNFQLRSMRKEVFVLARKLGVPCVELEVRVPVDVAIARNAERAVCARVPDEVIHRMAGSFADSDALGTNTPAWMLERHVVLDGTLPMDVQLKHLQALVSDTGRWETYLLPSVGLLHRFESVPPTVVEAVDLELRRLVNEYIQERVKSNGTDLEAVREASRRSKKAKDRILGVVRKMKKEVGGGGAKTYISLKDDERPTDSASNRFLESLVAAFFVDGLEHELEGDKLVSIHADDPAFKTLLREWFMEEMTRESR